MNAVIERLESNVRSYCRSFPTTFTTASGARVKGKNGRSYIDFFAGAGALNYGHNHPVLRDALLSYLTSDGMVHGLDLTTAAKCQLLETMERVVFQPRGLSYKVMFCGPTGTNAVESALKLSRKVTGRNNVIAFTHAFHGMTLGSLALTGNSAKRVGAGTELGSVTRMPFDGYMEGLDSAAYLDKVLTDPSSGVDRPAAIIFETVQGEGGVNVASVPWMQKIQSIARQHGIVLIVDDIQVGCGRSGSFFSFEQAGLRPDVVCLSKSFSGYGLPMALVLIAPELDAFSPGEHNGTFRGHNLAFVTAEKALSTFWQDDELSREVSEKSLCVANHLNELAQAYGGLHKGRGFIQGVAFAHPGLADAASKAAFEKGLIVETAGAYDEVLKVLPPLTIDRADLLDGLDILHQSVRTAARRLNVSREGWDEKSPASIFA